MSRIETRKSVNDKVSQYTQNLKTLINDLLLPLKHNIYTAFGKSQSMIKLETKFDFHIDYYNKYMKFILF